MQIQGFRGRLCHSVSIACGLAAILGKWSHVHLKEDVLAAELDSSRCAWISRLLTDSDSQNLALDRIAQHHSGVRPGLGSVAVPCVTELEASDAMTKSFTVYY